jgi:hypothetical protein
MKEACGIKGFIERVLYKISGQKIISFFAGAGMIYLVVWAAHRWTGQISDAVLIKAIEAIKTTCIVILGTKAAQNIVGTIKGNGNGENNG